LSFRQERIYDRAQHIVMIESNCGGHGYANIHFNRIRAVAPHVKEYRFDRNLSGIPTTAKDKQSAVYQMIWDMCHGRIHIAERLCTSNPKSTESLVDRFHEQCSNLRQVFQDGAMTYSAKRVGVMTDDMLVAYMLAELRSAYVVARGIIDHTENILQDDVTHWSLFQTMLQGGQTPMLPTGGMGHGPQAGFDRYSGPSYQTPVQQVLFDPGRQQQSAF
jgi:hypothetical protein